MSENDREYKNDDITVYWKPDLCIHSEVCFKKLPRVFNPKRRPWVKMDASTTEKIIETVDLCPTGALTYVKNNSSQQNMATINPEQLPIITTMKDGPFVVSGNIIIVDIHGTRTTISGKTALCRCGASLKQPFCDGNHRKIDFRDAK
jgi:uncharacterized Fe-S cluster protein YjdI